MSLMTVETTIPWAAPGRSFTTADLDRMPDDGRRYELLDGLLVVTPAPGWGHQLVITRLVVQLDQCRPSGAWCVLCAPFDVELGIDKRVQPDVLVARKAGFTQRNLPVPPTLAVEVASPSTRRYDRTLKRDWYESVGVAAYWIVDPHEPSITAWELRGGGYVEAGHVVGDERFTTDVPYPVTVVPSQLAGDPAFD